MRKRQAGEYPVAVFDIGGTWFRSALLRPDGTLAHLNKSPAINYLSFPHDSPVVLQMRLAEFLLAEVTRLGQLAGYAVSSGAISLGAALNARTGLVLNSGPLWGPGSGEFDLLAALGRRGGISWQLFNDITANLLYHSITPALEQYAKIALITISTGIGMRTCEKDGPIIPVDRVHGVQGEIGHIPVHFQLCGRPLELYCDCGGKNHLNAFCSGRGIGRVLEQTSALLCRKSNAPWLRDLEQAGSEEERKEIFSAALCAADPLAGEILDCLTRPLAEMLVYLFTIDPAVEKVVLTGGVVESLGERYIKSLLNNALEIGLYQVTNRDPSYFCRRITKSDAEDHAGLIGAGLFIDSEQKNNLITDKH